jgi:hypothetical protein
MRFPYEWTNAAEKFTSLSSGGDEIVGFQD